MEERTWSGIEKTLFNPTFVKLCKGSKVEMSERLEHHSSKLKKISPLEDRQSVFERYLDDIRPRPCCMSRGENNCREPLVAELAPSIVENAPLEQT